MFEFRFSLVCQCSTTKLVVTQRRLVTIQQHWLWANHFCWQSQTRLTMTLDMRNIGYSKDVMRTLLGGGFNFLLLLLLLGEMIQFDYFFSIYQLYTLKKFHKLNKRQLRKTSSFIPCLGKYHPDVTRPKTAPKDSLESWESHGCFKKSRLVKSAVHPDTWNSLKVQVKICIICIYNIV